MTADASSRPPYFHSLDLLPYPDCLPEMPYPAIVAELKALRRLSAGGLSGARCCGSGQHGTFNKFAGR
jgi:hypothetical protein